MVRRRRSRQPGESDRAKDKFGWTTGRGTGFREGEWLGCWR